MAEVHRADVSATSFIRQATDPRLAGPRAGGAATAPEGGRNRSGSTQAHANLISLYARLNDAGKAEEHYRKAIGLSPNQADAHYNYGVLLFGQRKPPTTLPKALGRTAILPRRTTISALLETEEQSRRRRASRSPSPGDRKPAQLPVGSAFSPGPAAVESPHSPRRSPNWTRRPRPRIRPVFSTRWRGVWPFGNHARAVAVMREAREKRPRAGNRNCGESRSRPCDLAKLGRDEVPLAMRTATCGMLEAPTGPANPPPLSLFRPRTPPNKPASALRITLDSAANLCMSEIMGSGVALLDYDNDGDLDVSPRPVPTARLSTNPRPA